VSKVPLLEELPPALAGRVFIFWIVDLVGEPVAFIALFVREDFHEPEVTVIFRFYRIGFGVFNHLHRVVASSLSQQFSAEIGQIKRKSV
jgi:hypothetical protein